MVGETTMSCKLFLDLHTFTIMTLYAGYKGNTCLRGKATCEEEMVCRPVQV